MNMNILGKLLNLFYNYNFFYSLNNACKRCHVSLHLQLYITEYTELAVLVSKWAW